MIFESILINVSVIVILIIALVFDYITKYFSYWYVRHIQYKTSVPFFGSDYHRVLGIRNTTDEVNTLYTKYSKENFIGCIKSRMPDLIVKDPDTINKILSTNFANFHYRGYELDKSRDVCLRNNLFYAEGEKWTLLRRKLELLLNHMGDDISNKLQDCLSGNNGNIEVQQLLSKILDIIFKDLIFNSELDDIFFKRLREIVEKRTKIGIIKSYIKCIFPSLYVLFGLNQVSPSDINIMKDIVNSSKLLKNIEKVENLDDNQMKGDKNLNAIEYFYSTLFLFISEGYIPCHNALTAILFELARNLTIQDEIRKCNETCAENDSLNRVIDETLRLYPPYSVITRQCTKSCNISDNGFLIDKSITVTIPISNLHKDEKHFQKSEEFKPNRFSKTSQRPMVFLPFGSGPRKCVGERLAMRILCTVTSEIIRKYHLETTEKTPPSLSIVDYNFKRVIKDDVWLKFKPI